MYFLKANLDRCYRSQDQDPQLSWSSTAIIPSRHDQPPCMSLLTTEGLKTLFNGVFFAGLIIESGVYKMIEFISITNVNLIKM